MTMTTPAPIVPTRYRILGVVDGRDLLECGHTIMRLAGQSAKPGRTALCFACIKANTPKPKPKWPAPHARRRPPYKLWNEMRKVFRLLRERQESVS